jgi:cell division septal protein FtsQ
MTRKRTYARTKQRSRYRLSRKRVILVVEIFVSAAFLAFFSYQFYEYTHESTQFTVREVRIEGIRRLDEDSVLLQSGIAPGNNVLYFAASEVRENVEAMPLVKTCIVSQIFPDTVVLTIDERVPFGTIQVNSRSYEIDDEGVVLREYGPDELPLAPFITNVRGLEFVAEGMVIDDAPLIAALEVWKVFARTPMAQETTVAEIAAESEDVIRMYCDELPYEIRWKRDGVAQQAERLNVLWLARNKKLECQEYLDLRFEDDLICK